MRVKLHEKVRRLVGDQNRAAIDRRFGLGKSTISNIINYKRRPRSDNVAPVARALDVSLEWLADDSAPWPPIKRSEVIDFAAAVDASTMAAFEKIASEQGNKGTCLAAAVQLFLRASDNERASMIYLANAMASERRKAKAG